MLLLVAATMSAQVPVASDEAAHVRSDFAPRAGEQTLNCEVTPVGAAANFAFSFESGYVFHVPKALYSESDGDWIVFTAIRPEGRPLEDVSLIHRVPRQRAIVSGSSLDIRGRYFLGEGSYSVESTLRDSRGRVCRKHWRVLVPTWRFDRGVPSRLPPFHIAQYSPVIPPETESPDSAATARLTILLNAAAASPRRTTIRDMERGRLLGALTGLLEHLPTEPVRVIVFSLEQQKEVLRVDNFAPSDMNRIAGAIAAVPQATVDVNVLKNPLGHVDFLAGMIRRELAASDPADTVLFLGPTSRYLEKLPKDALPAVGQSHARVFYVRYERWGRPTGFVASTETTKRPQAVQPPEDGPFAPSESSRGQPDIISKAVAQLNGRTFIVHMPAELAAAIRKMEEKR